MSNPDLGSPDARAWVEVNLAALRANFRTIREVAGRRAAVIAMVKADGYGLGVDRVVRALDPLEPWGYGVATAEEGAQLRALGVERPIITFSPLPPTSVDLAAANRLTVSISDLDELDRWASAAERFGPLGLHVEVDTGMGRAGFDWRETGQWSNAVVQRLGPRLRLEGIFTHFHGADIPDRTPTAVQWERFRDALVQLPVSRDDLMVHACNSAAVLRWPEYAADAVRPGIFLYGGNPAPELDPSEIAVPDPVVAMRARVILIREVPPGTTVGYGATYAARGWERWGTLGIGYGDGLPRALGHRGSGLARGRRVPLLGRVSMDLIVVDLTGVPGARVGDAITLIGRDGAAAITLDEVAAGAETITYEILTRLGRRLPRLERDDEDA